MTISVIIPAYNEEKYIGQCIASVLKYKTADLLEIIVVDNACTDRTAEVAASYPMVRVVKEPQKGLTYARQKGLKEAQSQLLAYIDADNRLSKDWFTILEKEFAADPKLVCLSGPYEFYDLAGLRVNWLIKVWNYGAVLAGRIIKYAIFGGNFAAKKNSLLEAGGFDTSIEFYGEDTDIAKRLSAVGKVKFSKNFFVYSSARRLEAEGRLQTGLRYGFNYLSIAFLKRPVSKQHKDIR